MKPYVTLCINGGEQRVAQFDTEDAATSDAEKQLAEVNCQEVFMLRVIGRRFIAHVVKSDSGIDAYEPKISYDSAILEETRKPIAEV